jgi:hypothetical protein
MIGLRCVRLAIVCVLVCGFAMRSSDSTASDKASAVSTAQLRFDPRTTGKVFSTAYGRGAGFAAERQSAADKAAARAVADAFQRVFTDGFKNSFPALAQAYGLTISATAPSLLDVKVTQRITDCAMRCQTRTKLKCVLVDAAGKGFWQFESEVGPVNDSSEINAPLFGAFAVKVLTAMKKDGAIP